MKKRSVEKLFFHNARRKAEPSALVYYLSTGYKLLLNFGLCPSYSRRMVIYIVYFSRARVAFTLWPLPVILAPEWDGFVPRHDMVGLWVNLNSLLPSLSLALPKI